MSGLVENKDERRTSDDYDLLKAMGMSSFKSGEVVLDARRGDAYALEWIKIARARGDQ